MMYLTWHQDLAFQGITITHIACCWLKNLRFIVLTFELSRLKYRKNEGSSHGGHLSKPASFDKEKQEGNKPLARVTSFKNSMDEFNPFKVIFSC
jgi:hypothetical protein